MSCSPLSRENNLYTLVNPAALEIREMNYIKSGDIITNIVSLPIERRRGDLTYPCVFGFHDRIPGDDTLQANTSLLVLKKTTGRIYVLCGGEVTRLSAGTYPNIRKLNA